MGKNRKLRNGVDQVHNFSVIETENQNQKVPEDFLTSDDFCIVQKKRGNKKFLETPDFDTVFELQSNPEKHSDEDSGKGHTSFWKFNGGLNDNSRIGICDDFELQCSNGKQKDSAENLECQPDILENCDIWKINSEIPLANREKLLSGTVKPKRSNYVTSDSENLEIKSSFDGENLEIKSAFDKSGLDENNVCCMKKKSKKRERRKKSIDEEVEKLLRELENDEKSVESKSDTVMIASVSYQKSSQQLNCKDSKVTLSADRYIISSDEKGKNSEMEIADDKCKLENGAFVDSASSKNMTGNSSVLEAHETGITLVINGSDHVAKRSRRKKDKTKQKITENGRKNSDSCEMNSMDLLNVQENANEGSGFSLEMQEKLPETKSTEESDKRGKKRPNKKQLAIIHEALKKAKEEEERLKREEELKLKMAEEAERIRQEKLRQEQEKKERKKLKEKQRREKMKAEGRLLSKSQKHSRARMEATLAALRQQGVDVPQIGDKKPSGPHGPRLGNCKNFHRKRYDSCQSTQSSDSAIVVSERQKSESFSSQESSGKDSFSDLPNSFDSTDESVLMPESDKCISSSSEEFDGIEENVCCNAVINKVIEAKLLAAKPRLSKTGILSINKDKSVESDVEENNLKFRSPVVCVLGHVDTGKTKLLDYIRKTHVQDSEAGGITQQIGATMIPQDALKEKCKMVKNFSSFKMKIPGLLVIDTPGHESFSNLRSRGSSICDIAVLVVDVMHGLEPQTIESINLLKRSKTPFIVALNKIDRIYGWKSAKDEDIENTIKNQMQTTQTEFKRRCQEIILQFAKECLNAALFYENKDPRSYVSMVPTSAITGDGMGNVLSIITQLTQSLMSKKLIYSNELEATVLEVKAIPGLGTTIDVILVNGRIQEGDTIVLAGQEGPIVTQIRSLLMPQPLKELRVKNPYIEYKAIEGAQGVKITGKDLEKSIAGLPLFVASNHNMIEVLKDEINNLFHNTINSIKTSERGVYVQASTLGSLEALLNFLSVSGIPYFNVKIGPVVKKDVMKASIMLEHDIMYAAILAFDVKIERDAQELADSLGVHIFHADIIYHLFDMYIKFKDDLLLKRNEEVRRLAVFPCKLRILPEFVFNPKDPIILGVCVEQGSLKEGTPLCVPSKNILEIGVVSSIEMNNNKINCAKKGDEVCIKIEPKPGESSKTYEKHFNHEDLLISRISRQSIDVCKEHFRNELNSCDWHLMVELKKMLHIV